MKRQGQLSYDLTARLAEHLAEIRKQITTAFSGLDFSALVRRVVELQNEAKQIGDAGWTIPMWATPAEVPYILEQAQSRDIDSVFLEYYEADNQANYKHLKQDILAKLNQWHPLIEQCFTAFEDRLYLVVVPAMISVVEGAVAAAGGPDAWRKTDPKQTVKKLLGRAADDSITRVIWVSVDAFMSHLFENRRFTGTRPSRLNRAWILHGRDAPSWTKADCLRLFQAADTISI